MRQLAHSMVFCLASCASCAHGADSKVYMDGVVAADHPAASRAGARMLELGGNAVDAAVATSFALSVVRPQSCGIGGGGFMVVYLREHAKVGEDGPIRVALNYREQAPAVVDETYFERLNQEGASTVTGHAVGVPGTVPGLLYALEVYGTLDRATVLGPAIALAVEGFAADGALVKTAHGLLDWYEEEPARKETHGFVWRRFMREGELEVGDVIRNPEQAHVLRMIADDGLEAWNGPIAEAIARTVREARGVMTVDDIESFEHEVMQPLEGSFGEYGLMTMPPPSSGGVALLQIAAIVDRLREVGPEEWGDYEAVLVEAFKHAFADRARWLGDGVDVSALLDGAYLDELASRVEVRRTRESEFYGTSVMPPDDSGTSHISVIDSQGNAVACTETINLSFGSKLAVEEFGFCLNNQMDDFTTVPGKTNAFGLVQSSANVPGAGKRPLSSMTPVIVVDEAGEVVCVAGASGGPRIITGVAQVVLGVLMFGMDAAEAVGAPRLHHQWSPDVLGIEEEYLEGLGDAGAGEFETMGHRVELMRSSSAVQAIVRVAGGGYTAVSDLRKGGVPAGPATHAEQTKTLQQPQ